MANKIIDKMDKGEKAVGISLSFYADEMVELAGAMGLDFVNYDGQHAPVTPETIDRFCRLCDGWGVTPTMRVPDQIPSNILNYIDRGIKAITVPFVNTKAEAEAVVDCCYFAPKGHRSYTSKRVMRFGLVDDLKDMMDRTNDDLLVMPQIEDIKAYNNLDEILKVDGIKVFAGGPNDLAQSMGHPGQPDHPDCLKVTSEGTAKIHAAGKFRNEDVMISVDATIAVRDAMRSMLDSGAGIRSY
ncbi:MAG: aldolase/citrate lyase family protein [SAR202 cluster bacterium]|nr:aldolase/citrate lyase family protein [SAR202 cluster bacterium]